MRILLQRVESANVSVGIKTISAIGSGLCVFLGVSKDDTGADATLLANKTLNLRIFPDESGKFNRSVVDSEGEILVVPQFTLYGECLKGRRPSLTNAANPKEAERLYRDFVTKLSLPIGPRICTGIFGAHMKVSLINDGPVTFFIDSMSSPEKTAGHGSQEAGHQ